MISALVLVSAALAGAACVDASGPHLDRAEPAAASPGALVTLTGQRLCGGDCAAAGGAIRIGLDEPVQAMILAYDDTTAQIRIPTVTPIGRTAIVATVNERASNALDFEVLAPALTGGTR